MTIGIDPIIGHLGGVGIAWHGIMMALGMVTGIVITLYFARKAGIKSETIYAVALWGIIGGMIGTRLVHVLDNLDYYASHAGKIIAIWDGGMAWYGGLFGGIVAVWIYTRVRKISMWQILDVAALGTILGLAVGRIGCTLNGDACGSPTSLPWAITYINTPYAPYGIPTHPAPVYEIIWILIISVVLWRLWGRLRPPGSLFLLTAALYSAGRFGISWVRNTTWNEPAVLGPFHQAHIISLVLFIVAVFLLFYRKTILERKTDCHEQPM